MRVSQFRGDCMTELILQGRVLRSKIFGCDSARQVCLACSFRFFFICSVLSEWEQERSGWRAVVQLNIVRSIIAVLGVVEAELNGDSAIVEFDDDEDTSYEIPKFSDAHQLLMIRLAPLRNVEADLKRRLGSASEPSHSVPTAMAATPFETPTVDSNSNRSPLEFSVRSWNDVIAAKTGQDDSSALDSSTITLAACKNDMKSLWADKAVQLALARRRIRLPDSAGL